MTEANKPPVEEAFAEAVYNRLIDNITIVKYLSDPQVPFPPASFIPQRPYCQGGAMPDGTVPQSIRFVMTDDRCFPAELALAERYNLLAEADVAVFTDSVQTINMRIEWPGYNGWGTQIRTVNYQAKPKGITRSKLVTEIAKQLVKFIQIKQFTTIDPAHATYRIGAGGIELSHIYIASLDQVSRGSWQPRFICVKP